ncbi:hypothetical protein EDD22DRAFT_854329 [Suillus occidentalis]|nr:hypothetical protein EDD22DRAFT_854329 [Suillus occidentalis]
MAGRIIALILQLSLGESLQLEVAFLVDGSQTTVLKILISAGSPRKGEQKIPGLIGRMEVCTKYTGWRLLSTPTLSINPMLDSLSSTSQLQIFRIELIYCSWFVSCRNQFCWYRVSDVKDLTDIHTSPSSYASHGGHQTMPAERTSKPKPKRLQILQFDPASLNREVRHQTQLFNRNGGNLMVLPDNKFRYYNVPAQATSTSTSSAGSSAVTSLPLQPSLPPQSPAVSLSLPSPMSSHLALSRSSSPPPSLPPPSPLPSSPPSPLSEHTSPLPYENFEITRGSESDQQLEDDSEQWKSNYDRAAEVWNDFMQWVEQNDLSNQ